MIKATEIRLVYFGCGFMEVTGHLFRLLTTHLYVILDSVILPELTSHSLICSFWNLLPSHFWASRLHLPIFSVSSILHSWKDDWSQWYQDTWILLEMLCCSLSSLGLCMLLSFVFIFPAWNFSWLLKIERKLELSSSPFSVIIFNMAFLTPFYVSDTQ